MIIFTCYTEDMELNCLRCAARFNMVHVLIIALCFHSVDMATGVVSSCPGTCQCSVLSDSSTEATCQLSQQADYLAVSDLPNNTTQLTCIINGTFKEAELQLSSLESLKKLVLIPYVYKTYYTADLTGDVSKIQRADLLSNLTLLEHLEIHIPVPTITPRVFDPVPDLTTLDLSYSRIHVRKALDHLLDDIDFRGRRLRNLILTGVQRQHTSTPPEPLKLRDHIYKNIKHYPLTTLDLLNNNNVMLQAGLTNYTPQLEELRIGAGRLLYMSEEYPNSRPCINTELHLHKSLREFVIEFPRVSNTYLPRRVRSPVENPIGMFGNIWKSVNVNSTLCDFANRQCQDIITIPCASLLNITLSDVFDGAGECYGQLRIPFSLDLETFIARNFPWKMRFDSNVTMCFFPGNQLKHLVFSAAIGSPGPLQLFGTVRVTIKGLRKLEFCNFQGVGIVFSPTIALFSDMPSLKALLLSRNNIDLQQWMELDFMNSPSLESLDIQSCGIDEVPSGAFSRLVNLRALNISDNRITRFDVNFANNRILGFVNLSRNGIRVLPKQVTGNLDRLAHDHSVILDLSQNPLSCYCENREFVYWIQSTQVNFKNMDKTFCAHPTIQLVHPWDVNTNDLQRFCIHFDAIISSVVSSISVALSIGAAALIYRRRWRIRFWIHATREAWKRKRIQEAPGRNDRLIFKYDAFVAYTSQREERSWVHMTLREKLEEEYGLKLCMYHRDFMAGRDLVDTIVEAIDSSNKTLLILSPAFLQSGWCEFEVRMAKEKLMTERRDSLVIVLYSKLDKPNGKFPKSLARLLDKKIYLEWTDDPEGQELFWRRLVQAIRSDQQHDGFAGCMQSVERMSTDTDCLILEE